MARWLEVKAKMQSIEELQRKELLALDGDVEAFFRPIQLDLEAVVTYSPLYNKDGEIVRGKSEVTLGHGGSIAIEMEFSELDKEIKNGRT